MFQLGDLAPQPPPEWLLRGQNLCIVSSTRQITTVTGPLFAFSDTWQLIINTGTQNSQNRDSAATQVKLDELIRVDHARNSLAGIEHLTDDELEELRTNCE